MNHTSPSHVGDGLNGALSDAILMVSTNPTGRESLLKDITVLPKLSRVENTIVGMQSLNLDANLGSFTVKEQWHLESVAENEKSNH